MLDDFFFITFLISVLRRSYNDSIGISSIKLFCWSLSFATFQGDELLSDELIALVNTRLNCLSFDSLCSSLFK